jgi:hypothetical protein
MKVKISEAKGQVLDYLVANAMGMKIYRSKSGEVRMHDANYGEFEPQTMGTPCDIERQEAGVRWATTMSTRSVEYGSLVCEEGCRITQQASYSVATGPKPLIAAMRCYVASKLGDEVEVPDELA